jgi:hypothetical protein
MTFWDLVRELGRSPPVNSNELFDIATSFASDEEAVGAIFDGKKGKRVDNAPAEGSKSKEPQQKDKQGKKGEKPRRGAHAQGRDDDEDEALAVDPARKGPRAAPRGPGVFDDMLKKPCRTTRPQSTTPSSSATCSRSTTAAPLRRRTRLRRMVEIGMPAAFQQWRTSSPSSGDRPWTCPTASASGSGTRSSLRRRLLLPSFLDWSEDAITFSREDHPNRIPNWGQYPLVVDPVIGNSRFSKMLMDGGSSLNILYAHTLWLMGIRLDQLRPSTMPFHAVTLGKRVQPLGQIDLLVWLGTPDNFHKETLTFKVVGFRGAYHAILGRPCYAKFMAVPNYTYLKMKMPGPKGVITVGSSIEHAFDCEVECVEHAGACLRLIVVSKFV